MIVTTVLRDLRRRSGLTQANLARRAGITPSVLSAYENGRRDPSATTFLRILRSAGFEPTLRRLPDPETSALRLAAVLELAQALPYRPRPLSVARVTWSR